MKKVNTKYKMRIETKIRYQKDFLSKKATRYNRKKIVHYWKTPNADEFAVMKETSSVQPIQKSFEKFPLLELKVLHQYLLDTLETQDLDTQTRLWYEINHKRVSTILKGVGFDYFCDTKFIYVLNNYKQLKNSYVGRLYASRFFSYNYLPREIRGLLADKCDYMDFDIVNAHPTLLLEYVHNNMDTFSPVLLTKYVFNRNNLLSEKSMKDGVDVNEAKRRLLTALNCSEKYAENLGCFCLDLYKECNVIREHLYENMYKENSVIWRYYKDNITFNKKTLAEQKVSVQSIYLQSKETDYVYKAIKYLRNEARDWGIIEESRKNESKKENESNTGGFNINEFTNVRFSDKLLDRQVDIDITDYYISCIPFYDGLYIGSEDVVFRKEIKDIMFCFNNLLEKEGSLVVFKEKKIEKESHRIDTDLFKLYVLITQHINTLDTASFIKLLIVLDVEPLTFSDVNNLDDKYMEDMLNKSREFKRKVYKRFIEVVEINGLVFDVNLQRNLTNIYSDKITLYKNSILYKTYDSDDIDLYDDDEIYME